MTDQISFCGINCSKCDAYLAKKENWSLEKRNKVAKIWAEKYDHPTLTGEGLRCDGCKSKGKLFIHCNKCEIRKKNLG
jgi:hypothetical protein